MPGKYQERVIHHPVLTLRYFVRNVSNKPPKSLLRVVVSTKIAKKATVRNLVRRRIKEIWRQSSIPENIMVTIYTKSPILKKSFKEVEAILTNLLRQLK